MAIVVKTTCSLADPLLPSAQHDAVVEFLDETRRAARHHPCDLAHLRSRTSPAHVDSAVNQAYIEYRRLWGDCEAVASGTDQRTSLIPRTAECSSLLSVLTLCILLSVLTVGFLLVALVCFRAIFGDILEDEIASLPRRSVYRAWGSCSAATSAWQGGKARNAEPFARKTNYR